MWNSEADYKKVYCLFYHNTSKQVKGDPSCKMHFCTSFIHVYVSPVCQGTHQVSENTTLSLFLHTQISKNGAATDLIQI